MRKKLRKGLVSLIAGISLGFTPQLAPADSFANSSPFTENQAKILAEEIKEKENKEENFALRVADEEFFGERRRNDFNTGNAFDEIISLLYPTFGRFKFVESLPGSHFMKHKVTYKELPWKRFRTQRFFLHMYDRDLLNHLVKLSEEAYNDYSKVFDFNKFNEPIYTFFYKTRKDFEQTRMIPQLIPEGLGGVTFTTDDENFRIVSLFEGNFSWMDHVLKHEYFHRFDVAVERYLPQWLIEGSAEYYSIGWNAGTAAAVRDAFLNDFIFPVEYMDYLYGSRLLYDEGLLVSKYLVEKYGEDALIRIRRNAEKKETDEKKKEFSEVLKDTFGIGYEELNKGLKSWLNENLSHILKAEDITDHSLSLDEQTILAANGEFFISGKFEDKRHRLYINHVDDFEKDDLEKVISEEIASDRFDGNQSLHFFRGGADINKNRVVYVIRNNESDVIRSFPYSYKKEEFKLGKEEEHGFSDIDVIRSPVIIDKDRIAFIGHLNGFSNIFLFNAKTKEVQQLTDDKNYYQSIDYSPKHNSLIFSREDEKTANPNKCDYNYNLYSLNLNTKALKKLTHALSDELNPKVSPDGSRVIFVSDKDDVYNFYVYDFATEKTYLFTDAKIGLLSPHWVSDNEIIFNSFKMLERTAHLSTMLSTRTIEKKSLKSTAGVPEKGEKGPESSTPKTLDGFIIKNSELFVKHHNHQYKIEEIAKSNNMLYLKTSDVNGNPDRKILLTYTNLGIENPGAKTTPPLEEILAAPVLNLIHQFEKKHTLIEKIISPDGKYVLMVTNNKLSFSKEAKEQPLGFYFLDVEKSELKKIDLDHRIKKLSDYQYAKVLAGGKLFLQLADDKILYDIKEDKKLNIFDESKLSEDRPIQFSDDNRYIAYLVKKGGWWKSKEQLRVYDALTKETKVLGITFKKGKITNLRFNLDGELEFMKEGEGKYWHLYNFNPSAETINHISIKAPKDKELKKFYFNSHKTVLLLQDEKKEEEDKKKEELYLYKNKKLERILDDYSFFGNIFLRGNELVAYARGRNKDGMFVYDGAAFKKAHSVKLVNTNQENLLLTSDENDLYIYNTKTLELRVVPDVLGFDVRGPSLLYSAKEGKSFDSFLQDLKSGKTTNLTNSETIDEILPKFTPDGSVEYITVTDASETSSKMIKLPEAAYIEKRVMEKEIPRSIFNKMNFSLMGAASTSGFFLFLDATSADLLRDHLLNVDFRGSIGKNMLGYQLGSISYVDLPKNYALHALYQSLGDNLYSGASYIKNLPLSRYAMTDFSVGYEYQDLNDFDFNGRNHVISAGVGFGYDTTLYNWHGPNAGFRCHIHSGTGFSVNRQNLNNINLDVEARQYFNLGDLVTLAYRAAAGTSQGSLPTLYRMGGNKTLRGVPIFSEIGNNYILAGTDLRFDIIRACGIQFEKELEGFNLLTIFPKVEFGFYGDVGDAWYYKVKGDEQLNKIVPFDLKYSIGWLVNIPTSFGLILRFNQGFAGEKDWNFWLGYNW